MGHFLVLSWTQPASLKNGAATDFATALTETTKLTVPFVPSDADQVN